MIDLDLVLLGQALLNGLGTLREVAAMEMTSWKVVKNPGYVRPGSYTINESGPDTI